MKISGTMVGIWNRINNKLPNKLKTKGGFQNSLENLEKNKNKKGKLDQSALNAAKGQSTHSGSGGKFDKKA